MNERYLNEHEVSEIIGRAVQTLRNDRFKKQHLPYCKIGRSVKYAQSDVFEYMESRKIIPEGNTYTK
jgi:predicted DNA-binding transcriptional regulator AlpA